MVNIINLKKAYGPKVLFSEVNLKLDSGKRYGLIGANGAGKTTFLKMLSGEEDITEGEVVIAVVKKLAHSHKINLLMKSLVYLIQFYMVIKNYMMQLKSKKNFICQKNLQMR